MRLKRHAKALVAESASAANRSDLNDRSLSANPLSASGIEPLASRLSGDTTVALAAGPSEGGSEASASSDSAPKSERLPDTGGVSPLVLITALLLVGGGILLITRRRMRFDT